MRYKQVVVIGSNDENLYMQEAYEIGKFIANKGWILISGGRGGIMEAASRGAYEEKGIVIGIIPDSNPDSANRYCNIVIPTGIGYARNMINVLSGDAIIAMGGKFGTLSELAYAQVFGKPIVLCAFAEGWSERLSTLHFDDMVPGRIYIAKELKDVFGYMNEILI